MTRCARNGFNSESYRGCLILFPGSGFRIEEKERDAMLIAHEHRCSCSVTGEMPIELIFDRAAIDRRMLRIEF